MKAIFGDKKFYLRVIVLALPILLQNTVTNFVSLLDNVMVGIVGTEAMSGVAIVNQLVFVFNLLIFGAVSAASIFGAQFFGQGNHEGVRNAFRFKIVICSVISVIGISVFIFKGESLINLYLNDETNSGNVQITLDYAKDYLQVILFGLIPFALTQSYSGTLRETGKTFVPMLASIIAVGTNLILNYLLIFGNLGCPKLGVTGAAIATATSRYIELLIVALWTHVNSAENIFIQGAYKHFRIPVSLCKSIFIKGSPLIVNEGLWAAGMATLNQCYSMRGLSVVAATNISSTIANLFNVVFIALGSTVSIIVGQHLGADEKEEAKISAYRLITFSTLSCIIVGGMLASLSKLFPEIYNTTEEVKTLAATFILIEALFMPAHAFMHASYFTLRSGGKTIITFLFDSAYLWVISIPIALGLVYFTNFPIINIYLTCKFADTIKCALGFILVKKGVWIQNITTSVINK